MLFTLVEEDKPEILAIILDKLNNTDREICESCEGREY